MLLFFFFNDTATTEIYTLSLHDALPIFTERKRAQEEQAARIAAEQANRAKDEFLAMLGHELRNPLAPIVTALQLIDRKSTRLNSSHANISYAVFCLKKKK